MARYITVYRKSDLDFVQSPPVRTPNTAQYEQASDAWERDVKRRTLYWQPLASEGAVYAYWSGPAKELGLSLLADIYDRGFYEGTQWSNEELDEEERELPALEADWLQMGIDEELLRELQTRMSYVQEAIRLARQHDGVVDIR